MIFYFIFFIATAWSDPQLRWTSAVEVVERHEFYQNHEIIKKPKGAWQTLFGVIYRDKSLRTLKDCVYYRVPGDEEGTLKIKTMYPSVKCEQHLFSAGDQEWKELKAFQFAITPERISVQLTLPKFKNEKWQIPLFNIFTKKEPKILTSSAEYRSSKMIFLSQKIYEGENIPPKTSTLNKNDLCHSISEICAEISPSICDQCPEGWYEIPNGCEQGPKYCGRLECGQKGQPACRRGIKWQREEKEFACRVDDSFAYCAKGLSIQCNGNLPTCI